MKRILAACAALLAFATAYEGNTDVYVVGVEYGVPRRLTFHPGADEMQGFTPDGKHVLFNSARDVFTSLRRRPAAMDVPAREDRPGKRTWGGLIGILGYPG